VARRQTAALEQTDERRLDEQTEERRIDEQTEERRLDTAE
jgi:hypothetical protein